MSALRCTVVLLLLAGLAHGQATPATNGTTPEETVQRYLAALQKEDFRAAYDCLSQGMLKGKSRDVFVAETQALLRLTETTISGIHVYPGKVEGDKAFVPNLLNSKDRFINQLGLPEHELYTLVREDGRWKVDQQTLLEAGDEEKWFPPEARTK